MILEITFNLKNIFLKKIVILKSLDNVFKNWKIIFAFKSNKCVF